VDAAAAQCAPSLQAAGVSLRVHADPGLPCVRGDGFLLRQALVNLIDNAVDFSPASGVVELRMQRAGAELQVSLADRGPGVPDFALPRIFERFYSLPRPEGGSRSSGLGLCFVAEVALLHGGSVSVVNRDGGGATATLCLPLA